jgi:hypothetical protein
LLDKRRNLLLAAQLLQLAREKKAHLGQVARRGWLAGQVDGVQVNDDPVLGRRVDQLVDVEKAAWFYLDVGFLSHCDLRR